MPNPPTPPKKQLPKQIAGVDAKWVYIGGGAAILVVYFAVKRKSNTGATDVAAADTGAVTDSYGYDPYGGSYSAESSGTPYYDNTGSGGGSIGPVGPPSAINPTTGDPALPTTQASWLLQAEAALLAMGYAPDAVSSSLGAFAAGAPMTPTQAGAVSSAAGAVGTPPTSTVTTAVPAPSVTPIPKMSAPHLTGSATTAHTARFTWSAVNGATRYIVFYAGTPHLTYQAPRVTFESGKHARGFKYGPITVRAIGPNGAMGPASNAVTVTIR